MISRDHAFFLWDLTFFLEIRLFFGEVEIENFNIIQNGKISQLKDRISLSKVTFFKSEFPCYARTVIPCEIPPLQKKVGSTEKRWDLTKKKHELVRSCQKTCPVCCETGFFLWDRVFFYCEIRAFFFEIRSFYCEIRSFCLLEKWDLSIFEKR